MKIETCANRFGDWCWGINNARWLDVSEHVAYCEKCKNYEPKENNMRGE